MTKGVYVENLTEESAESAVAVTSILQRGARNRHIGATSMNKESSRSHTVFTVTIQTKSEPCFSFLPSGNFLTLYAGTSGGLTKIKTSRLNLVDLAGSERQKAAQTEGQALKEASQINKSLSAIGNVGELISNSKLGLHLSQSQVIMALSDISAGRSRHVRFHLKSRTSNSLRFLLDRASSFELTSLGHRSTTVTAASPSYSKIRSVGTAELQSSPTYHQVLALQMF
jgi:hypothetical protein